MARAILLGLIAIGALALSAGEVKLISIADPAQISDTPGGESRLYPDVPSKRMYNRISTDGRFIVFESTAGNLVPAGVDNNGVSDIFAFDRLNGTVTLVSVNANGTQSGNGLSRDPVISRNGRFVAFVSLSSDLVAGGIDANDASDVFVRDLQSGTTALISVNALGTASGNGASDAPSISDDGKRVAFQSLATNLDALVNDANGLSDVFIRDRVNGQTKLASTNLAGTGSALLSSRTPVISGDGSRIAFISFATNLVSAVDTNTSEDVYAYTFATGVKVLVSAIDQTASNNRNGAQDQLFISFTGQFVTFLTNMSLTNAVSSDANGAYDIYRRDVNGTTTLLVTRIAASATTGMGVGNYVAVTPDGNYVAFMTGDQTLVAGVSYPSTGNNIFRADLTSGTSSVVSIVSSGFNSKAGTFFAADDNCEAPSISDDGNSLVFCSFADNLTSGTLQFRQVMSRKMSENVCRLISLKAGFNVSGNSESIEPIISGDGGYIAYHSSSTDLVNNIRDINNQFDAFLRDIDAGETLLISVRDPSSPTVSGGGGSYLYDFFFNANASRNRCASADGRFVAFVSDAPNLVAGVTKGAGFTQVYVRDTVANATEVISVTPAGTISGNGQSFSPYVSADGRYVGFTSFSNNLVSAPAVGGGIHVYLRDRQTNTTSLVTVKDTGGASTGSAGICGMSLDGSRILFVSTGSDLIAGVDTNGVQDVYLRDMVKGNTVLVSIAANGLAGNGAADTPTLSDDGMRVAFVSSATNLLGGVTDANAGTDVYYRDLSAGTTLLLSHSSSSNTTAANAASTLPLISGDGRFVAFQSAATNLVVDPVPGTGSVVRVYASSVATVTTAIASRRTNGDLAENASALADIDRTGSKILFFSTATDLTALSDANSAGQDLFVYNTGLNSVSLVSVNVGGTATGNKSSPVNGTNTRALLSPDGHYAVFISDAYNLVSSGIDGNNKTDLYLRDLNAGQTRVISLATNGVTTANDVTLRGCITLAGNAIIFESQASNHTESDFNADRDVFLLALDNLPTFTPLPIVSVLEDAAPTTLDLSLYFSDVETPNLTYSVTGNSNAALFASVTIAAGKNLNLNYAANAFGTAQITVRATDNGGLTTDAVLSVTVTGVNDAPSFTKGADVTTTEASTLNTLAGWATNLSFGPTNENAQGIAAFLVSADLPQYFAVQPAVAANGTLTFTPAGNLNDPVSVIVTVQLKDNGGTLNNGVDTSAAQTFLINLTPVADSLVVLNRNDVGANSLRDCLNRARKGDTVTFDAVVFDPTNSDAATVIDVLSELPALDDGGVTLDASDRRVTLNGNAAGASSGLVISAPGNVVRGLNIIAFNRAGIVLQGAAANNIIGGSRLVGSGPNGQGLRISGNGSAGMDLKGIGVTGNVVKGCWIGLDAAGTGAQPNLTGLLIEGGASGNTIGGIDPGEANVISGNQFEGVTASDEGSDDNTIISNIVGATGVLTSSALSRDLEDDMPHRSAVSNGSAGVFLSKGTKGTMVGGPTTASSNAIAFNGGNGVEVRDTKTRRNAMRGNRIKKNKSGIALIDGANDGLTGPISEEFTTSASTAPAKVKVAARGRVSGNEGVVEIFNDDADQGETFVTRCSVSGGKWQADFEASSVKKVTATFTDASGNTSSFVVLGDGAGGGGGGGSGPNPDLDSDGDGFSDEIEVALGTSPTDAASTPLDGAPAGIPEALSLTLIQIKLNFLLPNADSIKIAGTLPAPDTFALAGAKVSTSVGGAAKSFTLDGKGAGISGLTKFKLSKPKLGLAKFSAAYAKETYSQLADEGLTGAADVLKQSRTVKVMVIFNGKVYAADRAVLYSAKKGKTGSAK